MSQPSNDCNGSAKPIYNSYIDLGTRQNTPTSAPTYYNNNGQPPLTSPGTAYTNISSHLPLRSPQAYYTPVGHTGQQFNTYADNRTSSSHYGAHVRHEITYQQMFGLSPDLTPQTSHNTLSTGIPTSASGYLAHGNHHNPPIVPSPIGNITQDLSTEHTQSRPYPGDFRNEEWQIWMKESHERFPSSIYPQPPPWLHVVNLPRNHPHHYLNDYYQEGSHES